VKSKINIYFYAKIVYINTVMRKLKAYLFPTTMLLTALIMAAIAAFISVSGLAKLFAGAGSAVLLMTGAVEFSKVVMTTYLHKVSYLKNLLLNIPMTIFVVATMAVTSLGVYGFLANGYTITAGQLDKNKGDISLVENKIKNHETKIEGLQSQKDNSNNRANKLTDLRAQQETRIDSLYKKGWYKSARKVEAQIKESNKEIHKLMDKSSNADSLIQIENEAIGELRNKIIDLNNSDVNAEIGPLKYIANLTGLGMDNVINYIILVLIFIFDPAAILMLIAANNMLDSAKEELEKPEPVPPVEPEVIEEEVKEDKENIEEISEEYSVETEEEKSEVEAKAEKFFEEKEKNRETFKEMVEEKNKELEVVEEAEDEQINEAEEAHVQEVEEMMGSEDEIKEYFNGQDEAVSEEGEDEEETKETRYIKLLNALFHDGEIKQGDTLPTYTEFTVTLDERGIRYNEKMIRDFLAACNLVHVIDTAKDKRKALKDLEQATKIIKNI